MKNKEMLFQAKQKEAENKWDEALDIYADIISTIEKPHNELLERCAWCASRAAKYSLAIGYFKELSELEPRKAKWFYCVGYQYYMQKNWDIANKWFQKALKLYPNYLIVKYRYGYSLRKTCGDKYILTKSEFWHALKQFNECEQIWDNYSEDEKNKNSKTYADICYQRGKLLVESNHVKEAINCFEVSLTLNKKSENCRYQLSKAYFSLGELGKAIEVFPNKTNKYFVQELKIDILIAENKVDNAEKMLKILLQTRRKDYLYRKMANIYTSKGDYLSAMANIIKAERINPKSHITLYEKAKILIHENILIAAKNELLHAIRLKKEVYGSSYTEAEDLLDTVEQQIIITAYSEDDQIKLELISSQCGTKKRLQGSIIKYNAERGFGFIGCNGQNYFFHISSVKISIQSMLSKGQKVYFDEIKGDKGLNAINISII